MGETVQAMIDHRLVPALLLGALLVLAGCGGPAANIEFQGDIDESNGTVTIEGEFTDRAVGDELRFENVTVYFFTANGTVVNSTNIGALESESAHFRATASPPPEYIVMYSRDFEQYEDTDFPYWEREDVGDYRVHVIDSRNDLPIQPP